MSEPRTVFSVGPADRGKRLDHFLKERIPGLSRTRLQEAIRTRIALSWDAPPKPGARVRPGGEVRIAHTPLAEAPLDLAIPILARGNGWLAVDKPPGIPVHPVNHVRENTLIRMLRRQEGQESLRLVHRLDRETSGVLLIATGPASASVLSTAFERGRVWKEYLAVVAGAVGEDSGRIDLPLGRARGSAVFVRRGVDEEGERASTAWTAVARAQGRTLLRVFPKTGRRHQIRVHLAAIGHPILGDLLYGRPDRDYLHLVSTGIDPRECEGGPRRQLLHCARILLRGPDAATSVDVEAPVPPDFPADLR